jgi:hypothetical protein
LFAGKTSTGFIKVTGSGTMSLFATDFTLSTDNIWLSDNGKTWNDHANVVLGLGDNFAVDSSGNLYANNANLTNVTASGTISASTITGSTISGAKISASEMTTTTITASEFTNGTTFNVTAGGHLNCSSATIGGWNVNESSLSSPSGSLTFSSGGGGITSSFFNSNADGKTTITDLEVLNSLTINGDAVFTCNGTGEITGNTTIGGTLTVNTDKIIVGTAEGLA